MDRVSLEQTPTTEKNKTDTHFLSFLSQRFQAAPINFSIVKQIFDIEFINESLETNAENSVFDGEIKNQLQQNSSKSFRDGRSETKKQQNRLYITNVTDSTDVPERQHDRHRNQRRKPRFLSETEDKIVNRHKKRYTATRIKYSPTRVKSVNILLNISYTGISKKDIYNEKFILDVYVLLVKNLNPFSLSRKVTDKTKYEMVYMLWRECILPEFYRYTCEGKNFIYLNGRDVCQPGVLEIVGEFIDQGKRNLRMLQEHLTRYKDIYQYVYSHVFPEIYTTSEKRGLDLKSNFHILLQAYCDKQIIRQHSLAKNQANYEQQPKEFNENEQKLIKNFNEFSDTEEQEVKERAKKRLADRREKKRRRIEDQKTERKIRRRQSQRK